ncbi:hypothetical protein [uncultured Tyzzerella sp.]|uniref:hypothetical protein n=1 Tax=uncultured Tyzzerella sp. TaxID=2321398 RepID=UPI002942D6E9|nr:hypothetical protein [uncultured Tyzzerella sp.]
MKRLGSRLDSMVNENELLINVVNLNRLKLLISLNQKVYSWITLYIVGLHGHKTVGEEVEPNLSIC